MKRGPESRKTIQLIDTLKKKAVENKAAVWRRVAERLSKPARRRSEVNVHKINRCTKQGDMIVVPGKVLGSGSINHAVTVAAHSFSASAVEKIRKAGGSCISIEEAVERNPKGSGVVLME
ncbi:MAG: 50S ribosomal protein L18e [Candidatus Micrarchaeia archaeon]